MEIEIVTTKKKLTKGIIEQIPHIKTKELEDANVLGHVILDRTIIIFEIDRFEYRKAYWHCFKSGTKEVYMRIGRYKEEWYYEEDMTECCGVAPITNEKYCPNCGRKIIKK